MDILSIFRKKPGTNLSVPVEKMATIGAAGNYNNAQKDPNPYLTKAGLSSYAAITAVLACLQIRADAIGSIPLLIEKKVGPNAWEEDPSHRCYPFARHTPYEQGEITTSDFLKHLSYERDMHGRYFGKYTFDDMGRPNGVIPVVNAGRVSVLKNQFSEIYYNLDGTDYSRAKMLHIKNLVIGGPFEGASVLEIARDTFNTALNMQAMVDGIIDNSVKPGMVLSTNLALKQEQMDDTEKRLKEKYSDYKNAGSTLILSNGLKPEKVSFFSEADVAFLTSRTFTYAEIASLFRIPAYQLNLSGDRKAAASQEQEQREFMQNCIRPSTNAIEDSLNLQMLTPEERGMWRFRFDYSDLIEPDIAAKYAANASALASGWKTINEVRVENGYPPIAGGDVPMIPLNKGTMSQVQPLPPTT